MWSTLGAEKIQQLKKIIRYAIVSGFTYTYALLGIYWLNQSGWIDAEYTYGLVYLSLYVIQYPILIKFVYQVQFKSEFVYRYAVFLLLNWVISSAFFSLLVQLGWGILWSFVVVTCVMFPIRFFVGMRIYK